MNPDSHSGGIYEVNNVYLDDRYDTCYNEKMLNSYVRDKYRIRYYNNDLSFIRFENKHKEGDLSYKTSVIMTDEELYEISQGNMDFFLTSQNPLMQKVANLHRLRQMRVAVTFSYTREAYVYKPGNVRVTFDSNICSDAGGMLEGLRSPAVSVTGLRSPAVSVTGLRSPAVSVTGLRSPAVSVTEVKFDRFLPSVIKEMLDGLPLIQTAMSKYCYSRERYGI